MRILISLALVAAAGLSAQLVVSPGGSGGGGGGGSGSGRVLIAETVASADASIDFDSVFDSTYDRYEIEIIGVLPATDDSHLTGNFRSGGSYQTSDYDARVNCHSSGTDTKDSIFGSAETVFYVMGADLGNFGAASAATGGIDATVTITDPASTSRFPMMFAEGVVLNPGAASSERALYCRSHAVWPGSAAAVTGVRFQFDSGNVASGTFRVWGLPKS